MINPLDVFEADPTQVFGLKVQMHTGYLRVIDQIYGTRFYPVVEGKPVISKATRCFTQTAAVKKAETLTLAKRQARDQALKAQPETGHVE